jgi:hypothetical protein
LRPQKEFLLKIKKYLSGKFLVKLGLFLVLLGGAWLFDHFHQGKQFAVQESTPAESKTAPGMISFYCTTPAPISLKAPVLKVNTDKVYQEKLNRMILEQMNARSVFLLKAEVLKQPDPHFSIRNLINFKYHFLHQEDDETHLC